MRRSLLWGAAFGLWWAAWGWALDLSTRVAWPGTVPVSSIADTSWISRGALLLSVLAAATPPAWALLERALALDPRGVAWTSFLWGLKASIAPGSLYLVVLLLSTAAAFIFEGAFVPIWIGVFATTAAASLFLAPLAILNPTVLAGSGALRTWRPRWPGARLVWAVVGLVLVAMLVESVGYLPVPEEAWSDAFAASLLVGRTPFLLVPADYWSDAFVVSTLLASRVLAYLVATGLYLLATTLLVHRIEPGTALFRLSRLLSWSRIGPWLAQAARIFFALLWLMPPIASLWLWFWQVLPACCGANVGQDGLPPAAVTLVAALGSIGRFWWFGAVLLSPLFFTVSYLYRGRLVWLLGEPGGEPRRLSPPPAPRAP